MSKESDQEQGEEVVGIFQQVNNEGRTIVKVTNELDIAQFCKRIVIVRDGKIVEDTLVRDRRAQVFL
ncbi:MAG: hypothetical protein NT023_22225 [Armatimonadetes bacterium]|nr:hypothetical protein [Armatimonadota bacterium]